MSKLSELIEADRKKVGGMTAGAMARLGLAELRQATALDGSVAANTPTPLGIYGTLTPGEVSAARQEGTVHGPAEASTGAGAGDAAEADPVQAARAQAAASATDRERERDRDRGAGA